MRAFAPQEAATTKLVAKYATAFNELLELHLQIDGAVQHFNKNAETFEAPMANTIHHVTNLRAVFRI